MKVFNYQETKKLLSKYGISLCRGGVFTSKKEAAEFAEKIGFPVVLKILSVDVLHRTEIGGIKAKINNKNETEKAFAKILLSVKKAKPKAQIEGVLVQKQIKGTEITVGMKRDDNFGPVIMFGSGGVFVELLKDISFGICPLSKKEVKEMVRGTKVYKLFKGFRNFPKVDVEKISQIILNISKLALKEKNIKEIDFNPIICNEKQILVVDAKIISHS